MSTHEHEPTTFAYPCYLCEQETYAWQVGACKAELHDRWDGLPIDLVCELDADHQGGHSAGRGEWAWPVERDDRGFFTYDERGRRVTK